MDSAVAEKAAVIYARYSSHSQTEQSIEGQLRVNTEFAEREGYKIVGQYIDRAISGTQAETRPDFQRMIADAKKRTFDYVIVYKLDRFARNRYDSAVYKHKLNQYGVRVVSATENISDSPEGIILEAVLEASAEYYSRELSQKVKRGLRESILKGQCIGGARMIGYKVIDKHVYIDEETAPYVRFAFEQYANGVPKKEIIAELARRGIKNAYGKTPGITFLQSALKNKRYTGVLEYEGVEYTNIFPQIISNELFDKVQQRLKAAARAPRAGTSEKVEYLLSGKAFCGKCGSPLVSEGGRSRNGSKHYYYACANKKKWHTCDKRNEKKIFLEQYIVEQTVNYVLQPDRLDYIAKNVVAEYNKDINDDKIKSIERQLAKLETAINKTMDLIYDTESKAMIERYEKRIEEYDMQKNDLAADLIKLKNAADVKITADGIKTFLKALCVGDSFDPAYQKRVIEVLVNSVYVYDDKLLIYYNVTGGKQVNYIDFTDDIELLGDLNIKGHSGSILDGYGQPYTIKIEPRCTLIFKHRVFGLWCVRKQ